MTGLGSSEPPATPAGGSAVPRRRWWRWGAALAVAGCVAGATVTVAGTGDPHHAAGAAAPPAAAGKAAVAALLARQDKAVLTRDRAAYLATLDPAAADYRAAQGLVFGDLAALPLAEWRQALDPVQPGAGATLRVTLRYRFAGYDTADVTSTRYVTARRTAGGWVIGGDGSPAGLADDPQIWSEGLPLTVAKGIYGLVIGVGRDQDTVARLQDVARVLDAAVPVVDSVVGRGWARRVVALAPADDAAAGALAGGGTNLHDLAALATGHNRVVIAPDGFGRLNALGRHVVLTHELTHVATGAAADATTPLWLVEGLADYAGYKGRRVSVKDAARELAAAPPKALPGQADFTGATPAAAYEGAWLACRMIAERYGEPALVRLYRTAGAKGQEAALRDVLGQSTAEFTTSWRAYVASALR